MIAKEKSYDYEYYMSLPEGSRIELIYGQIYNMPPAPSFRHQAISSFLHREISTYLKGKSCIVFHAPFDVYLVDNGRDIKSCKNIVQPDITVICDKSKFHSKGCLGAPDFVIEIVSHSSRMMDYVKKLYLYSEFGVKEYWIVDPIKQEINTYNIKDDDFDLKTYSFNDKIKANIFNDLVIDFDEFDSDFINE